jgi:hypothetical protein
MRDLLRRIYLVLKLLTRKNQCVNIFTESESYPMYPFYIKEGTAMIFPNRLIPFNSVKPKVGLFAILILLIAITLPYPVRALTVSSSRDCDANAVVKCGALSVDELQNKYNNDVGAQNIYNAFGISQSDIAGMDTTAVAGRVTSGGRVIVNGDEVARNVVTAGRQFMKGSHSEDINGTVFYTRSPSVSFASSSLPAFVVMDNGTFDFAVIASCGNPVKSTGITAHTKTTTQQKTVVRTPAVTPSVTKTPPPSQTQSITVAPPVTYTPPPAPVVYQAAPAPAPTIYVAPKEIPNTGVGDIAGFGSFVTLVSGAAHFLYKRKLFS